MHTLFSSLASAATEADTCLARQMEFYLDTIGSRGREELVGGQCNFDRSRGPYIHWEERGTEAP